ncbi:hypothetical protein PPTG_03621 [Phytophthora nicotianae INRA-310]|uniref:Uncharacterized protein n=1 Tax=Phytophthora nicotianae (strain INRA-310) TaxID=761204 RepID=W2R5J2_PHYN3|nr:hypothetical protein PPTG_03621 [Phytophthora nicotianae INRA-310]ETN20663.1 hypothetical protein PPTG_03621 [Phytophthora nicotianae INRA-310]
MAIHARWDMMAMVELEKDFRDGLSSLRTVETSMKVANAAYELDGLTQVTDSANAVKATRDAVEEFEATHDFQATQQATQGATQGATREKHEKNGRDKCGTQRQPKRRVVYVKMRRRERANVVVLSSEEKYCFAKAVFEPVMEHLAELSSPAFYSALKAWKNVVNRWLHEVGPVDAHTSEATTAPEDGSGEDSDAIDAPLDIAPADLIDTMNFTREMEQSEFDPHREATVTASSHETEQVRSTSGKETALFSDSGSIKCKDPAVNSAKAAVKSTKKGATHTTTQGGRLEVLRIPKPKPRCNQRKKLKQARLEKRTKPDKLAVITFPEKNVPSLSRVIVWATNTIDRHRVSEILASYPTIMDDDFMNTRVAESCRSAVSTEEFDYNFVIPKSLVIKLKAVIQAERNKRPKSKYFNTEGEDTDSNNEAIVAYFPGVTPRFTRYVITVLLIVLLRVLTLDLLLQCCLLCCCNKFLYNSEAVFKMAEFYNVVKKM